MRLQSAGEGPVHPDPDVPEEPDRDDDLHDLNPGRNPGSSSDILPSGGAEMPAEVVALDRLPSISMT